MRDSALYLGLFLVVFLGEAGVPMLAPVELALIGVGVAFAPDLDALGALAMVAVTADVLGTLCLFALTRAATKGKRLPHLWRRVLAASSRAAIRIGAHDARRVAAGRCVPFLRVPTAGAAALAGLSLRTYAACALAGGAVWTAIFLGGAAVVARLPA